MLIGVISDVHSNLAALKAVLIDMPPVRYIWNLGDIVGYGPDPNECLELLRERKARSIAGNHDWGAVDKVEIENFNIDAQEAILWTAQQLTESNQEYLKRLRDSNLVDNFTLVHGSPREHIWEYVNFISIAKANFTYFFTPYCLIGHTHIPLIFYQDEKEIGSITPDPDKPYKLGEEKLIINPGSVGQPRDGNPMASYVLLDTKQGTITYRRVAYPVEETQEKMMGANLPERLIERLSYGY